MTIRMKKLAPTITLLALTVGCASTYQQPESVEDKIIRYQTRTTNPNPVPQFEVLAQNVEFKKRRASRGPASIGRVSETTKGPFKRFSNKRLYFLTLLSQYKHLQSFSKQSQPPQINICPSFHTSLVDLNEKQPIESTKTPSYERHINKGWQADSSLALYPELSLPITVENSYPRVIDILRNENSNEKSYEVVAKGLRVHLAKTYQELSELCESGTSDNYYSYENLLTQIKKAGRNGANHKSLKILLKTTLFTNQMLIHSLSTPSKARFPASNENAYYGEVMKRLKAEWSKDYFKKIEELKASTKNIKPIS